MTSRLPRVLFRVAASLSLAASLLSAACEPASDEPACTDEVADSVQVNVVDDAGEAVTDAVVTFSTDGGIVQRCTTEGDGRYACGVELFGDFVINVTRTGFVAASANVTVDADACHVLTEIVDIALAPVP